MNPSSVPVPVPPGSSQPQGRLEGLPFEMLGYIFECSQPDDTVALGLCSRYLWGTFIKWAQNRDLIWTNTYSFARTPIMHASSWLKTLPPYGYDMYPNARPEETEEEEQQEEEVSEPETRQVTQATILFDNFILRSHQAPFPCDYIKSFDNVIATADIPGHLHESMRSCLPTMTIQEGSQWLLRNVTNNEYIRMEKVVTDEGEETVSHVGNSWLTLDMLLIWLITWKGDDKAVPWSWKELERYVGSNIDDMMYAMINVFNHRPGTDYVWPIWRGNWAGHSLEVVTDRKLDEVWIDRTSEIETLALKIAPTMYVMALQHGTAKARRYWEIVLDLQGYVHDEERDGVTHKIIHAGAMRKHSDYTCYCHR
ncbi:hypothetical protein FPOAC2_10216 [Fusarium poae]|uniref:F-box domain-containing protein n=1 Tax=Fusarium poae TaxID=36050 RepID=A0A1B8ARR4_FUSPO|nr:hypothetical protein FPOAC1_007385 [Fusarium poae]KAG8668024.1 hypothetical protein FPOAC1_007385 [Fusarium poae]OBS23044.1 hypothetical protein FPOA_09362 [Fusarium poae]